MSTDAPRFTVLERVLAYLAITIIAVTVLAFLTTLVVAMVSGREALTDGLWPLVTWLSFFGLPIGFVMVIALLVINFVRRGSRKAKR